MDLRLRFVVCSLIEGINTFQLPLLEVIVICFLNGRASSISWIKHSVLVVFAYCGPPFSNKDVAVSGVNGTAELAVGNIVRRVLHIIREEDLSPVTSDIGGLSLPSGSDAEDTAARDSDHVEMASAAITSRNFLCPPSLHTLMENMHNKMTACQNSGVDSEEKVKTDKNGRSRKLKHDVIEAVNVLIEDIDTYREQIAEQAVEHIHQNEVILTLGHSRTVLEFLSAARDKKRSFQVVVVEGAPSYQGHVLANELAKRGVRTTVITDSAVFAMISHVNMVIVGVNSVMANGGVIAPVGMRTIALAAHKYAVPFVVVAGIHELCPLYPHNPEVLLNSMRSSSELVEFGDYSNFMDYGIGSGYSPLHVANPAFDYVPPELVSLFITDIGGHNPSCMYRLISDYYSAEDLVL
ncbi:hypothetical protein NMG60_11017523 [Bertholletia excelsa]